MIIEIRAKNIFVFKEQIAFSMNADMRNKKFVTNVHKENNFNILKVAGIYGPNNAGKTCLVRCIRAIRNVFLDQESGAIPNMFTDNPVYELGVNFLYEGREFSYDFKYNATKKEYLYERFLQIFKDQYGNRKEEIWLLKDNENQEYSCIDVEMLPMMSLVAQNNIMIYMVDTNRFKKLEEMKHIMSKFASNVDIINMNNIPLKKTIELMKNKNGMQKKIVSFIKNADLYMENFNGNTS